MPQKPGEVPLSLVRRYARDHLVFMMVLRLVGVVHSTRSFDSRAFYVKMYFFDPAGVFALEAAHVLLHEGLLAL